MGETELLRYAASVEASSEHPLGDAVVRKAKNDGLDLLEIKEFNSFGGKGVKAIVNGKEIIIGNRSLFSDKNIEITDQVEGNILQLEKEGKTVL